MSSQIPSIDEIKNLSEASSLVKRLKETELNLSEHALNFLEKQLISGEIFLKLTLSELKVFGLELGPSIEILQAIKKMNDVNLNNSNNANNVNNVNNVHNVHNVQEENSSKQI